MNFIPHPSKSQLPALIVSAPYIVARFSKTVRSPSSSSKPDFLTRIGDSEVQNTICWSCWCTLSRSCVRSFSSGADSLASTTSVIRHLQMLHFCARVDLRRVDGVIPFGIFIHGAQYPEAQLSRRWQDTGSKTSSGWLITLVDIVRSLLWLAVETHGILPVGRAAMVLLDAV